MLEHPPYPAANFHSTLLIPTYNAASFIISTVERLRRFATEHPGWCVLFVCDGCTDSTVEQLSAALHASPRSMLMDVQSANRGKGAALRRGLSIAQTPFVAYTDVDLAYDPDDAVKLVELLEAGADIAVANRADPDSRFFMSPRDFPSIYRRHRMSRAFNWCLRHLLPIAILDTQAGLKALTLAAWERLAPNIVSDGFFFDVELLAWAGAMKMAIAERPVKFRYVDPTTVRMFRHGWGMIPEMYRLYRALRQSPAAAPLPSSVVEGVGTCQR